MRTLALLLPTLVGLGATGCDAVLSPADPGILVSRTIDSYVNDLNALANRYSPGQPPALTP